MDSSENNVLDTLPNEVMLRIIKHYMNEDPEIQKQVESISARIAAKYIKEVEDAKGEVLL